VVNLPLVTTRCRRTGVYSLQDHLDRVDSVIMSVLLDRIAITEGLHRNTGLELGTMGAALVNRSEPLSGELTRLRGHR